MNSAVHKKIVLIGASTGGPGQIQKIVTSLPKLGNSSVIIAQHMVNGFLKSFITSLQKNTHNNVLLVEDKQPLEPSCIYICENNTHIDNTQLFFHKKDSPLHGYNPDINILFNSFVRLHNDFEILCVILTGIGADGVEASVNLSQNGVSCVTESAQSAIVDGMPHRARELVPNIKIKHIDEIVDIISEFCNV